MFNKKIFFSLVSIAAALSMVGGAAFAVFSSQAANANNTFGAGDMVLQLDGVSGTGTTGYFTVSGIAPGSSQERIITLKNNGSIGSSNTKLVSIGHSTSSGFDLGDKLTLEIWNDVDNNGVIGGTDTLQGSAHITNPSWNNIDLGFGLPASATQKIIAKVTFDSDADNNYQGANSTFQLNFQTNQ